MPKLHGTVSCDSKLAAVHRGRAALQKLLIVEQGGPVSE